MSPRALPMAHFFRVHTEVHMVDQVTGDAAQTLSLTVANIHEHDALERMQAHLDLEQTRLRTTPEQAADDLAALDESLAAERPARLDDHEVDGHA